MWNDCGCVSGLYLVAGDNVNCTQDPKDNNDVNCPSIDLMQANNYGFNVAANPCAGGNCDALSQCMWDMRDEGIAEYGSSAYGPGGSLINTYAVFHVKTEFLSTLDYQTLWGLRTTISQNGNTITMQKDCRGYIDDLNFDIEGHMSLVFTQWSNEDGRMRDFQTNNCPLYDAGCSNAYSTFYNLHIH